MPEQIRDARQVDPQRIGRELQRLGKAIENGNAPVQEINFSEYVKVENLITERVEVEYTMADGFDGIDPIKHDDGTTGVK